MTNSVAAVSSGESWLLRPRLADVGTVQIGRGHFEHVGVHGAEVVVHGWFLLPDVPLDSVSLHLDGIGIGRQAVAERPDVGGVFREIPHAARCGFAFTLPRGSFVRDRGWLQVAGTARGAPAATITSPFRLDLDEVMPAPPADLMMRVAHTTQAHFFRLSGLKVAGDLLSAVAEHLDLSPGGRLLDWGCGPGRALWHVADALPGWRVEGCDIDEEAIEWCRSELGGVAGVATIPLMPPTAYEDGAFDVVTAYSVLTHLSAEAQNAWLAEIARVLRPGGIFAASVHGDFASSFATETALNVLRYGIDDTIRDHTLDAVAPAGYYRGAFQSSGYTLREYARTFEIVDYRDRGAASFQDLVVMRKPGA